MGRLLLKRNVWILCIVFICASLISMIHFPSNTHTCHCECSAFSALSTKNAVTEESVITDNVFLSTTPVQPQTQSQKPTTDRPKKVLPVLGWLKRVHWTPGERADNYDFLNNPVGKCKVGDNSKPITLLVIVKSATYQTALRESIRNTYISGIAKYNVSARVVFNLGKPEKHKEQENINEEARTYGDILQADYTDHYYNLTKKLIMGLKWAVKFCNSEFVMSTDDDVMVDIVTLVNDLQALPLEEHSNFVIGKQNGNPPVRNEKSKWYCPKEMYPNDRFPPFPLGHGYVLSQNVVQKLYRASKELPPEVPFDDVYCGILLKSLGIEIFNRESWFRKLHPQKQTKDYVKLELSAEKLKTTWEKFEKNFEEELNVAKLTGVLISMP